MDKLDVMGIIDNMIKEQHKKETAIFNKWLASEDRESDAALHEIWREETGKLEGILSVYRALFPAEMADAISK